MKKYGKNIVSYASTPEMFIYIDKFLSAFLLLVIFQDLSFSFTSFYDFFNAIGTVAPLATLNIVEKTTPHSVPLAFVGTSFARALTLASAFSDFHHLPHFHELQIIIPSSQT